MNSYSPNVIIKKYENKKCIDEYYLIKLNICIFNIHNTITYKLILWIEENFISDV